MCGGKRERSVGEMVWRREVIVWVAVLVVAGVVRGARTQQGITVTSNAYSGVVVAIRDDLNMTQCPAYIDSIKVSRCSSLPPPFIVIIRWSEATKRFQ